MVRYKREKISLRCVVLPESKRVVLIEKQAFSLGFDVADSIALLRLDDLYIGIDDLSGVPVIQD